MIASKLRRIAGLFTNSQRSVLMTYPGLRMGNILYFALHAKIERERGRDYHVLDVDSDAEWRGSFPLIDGLMVPAPKLRFSDCREHIPESFFQHWGVDFTRAQLVSFIDRAILRCPAWTDWTNGGAQHRDGTVLNIRRGDYYSDPEFRKVYGFDIERYARTALGSIHTAHGSIGHITVVSDDVRWRQDNLQWLADYSSDLSYVGPESGIVESFFTIASARRLIITNSTFSYWAAYVSNVWHGDNRSDVWVPDLHSRAVLGGSPWQHDPEWRRLAVYDLA